MFGSKTVKGQTDWQIAAVPLLASIESFRVSFAHWFDVTRDAMLTLDPAQISKAEQSAGDLLDAYKLAAQRYEEWVPIGTKNGRLINDNGPQALIFFGVPKLIQTVELSLMASVAIFLDNEEMFAACQGFRDPEWIRYSMTYGPMDEFVQGRIWKPKNIKSAIEVATMDGRTFTALLDRWRPAGWDFVHSQGQGAASDLV